MRGVAHERDGLGQLGHGLRGGRIEREDQVRAARVDVRAQAIRDRPGRAGKTRGRARGIDSRAIPDRDPDRDLERARVSSELSKRSLRSMENEYREKIEQEKKRSEALLRNILPPGDCKPPAER